jgi:pantoate ligase / CMP/dCMP kinase
VQVLATIAQLRDFRQQQQGKSLGFVPTMGALHPGHLSLIDRARWENTVTVASIFVNPLQFGPTEDLEKYPRTIERDRQLCERAGVDVLFIPAAVELGITPDRPMTAVVPPDSMTNVLCGRSRVGHFQGVATIVTKLLNLVQPDRAYFGLKDAQQLAILRRIIADLNLPTEAIGCPIVREVSGLAYSSRNQYLNSDEKKQASVLYRSLRQAERAFRQGDRQAIQLLDRVKAEFATMSEIQLEYVELVHPETMTPLECVEEEGLLAIAARMGPTRLIDNLVLRDRAPIVAIDGPAGAGKSTVTRQVAQKLGLMFLDTGAMYRAVTWLLWQQGIAAENESAVTAALKQCKLELKADATLGCRVWMNDREITTEIRQPQVTQRVSAVSALPIVRQFLVAQQQRYGSQGGLVAEGRDIGTCVFPDADVKIYLTASVSERAKRRQQDLVDRGYDAMPLVELEESIAERDWLDSTRAISPLRKADDAIEIQTDALTIEQVVDRILSCCRW